MATVHIRINIIAKIMNKDQQKLNIRTCLRSEGGYVILEKSFRRTFRNFTVRLYTSGTAMATVHI